MPEATSDQRYLDAARACILQVGWRRTTLTDIAQRAGVSRMTIYRRWSDTRTLLADLLVREWSGLVVDAGLPDTPLATGIAHAVTRLRDNELFQRIVEVDPELLLPYLFERVGRNQSMVLALLEQGVRDGQERGEVRDGDPLLLAQGLLLTTYGFVLSGHTLQVHLPRLDAELHALVERYLAP